MTTTVSKLADNRIKFVTRRPFDTGDRNEDYNFELGQEQPFIFAWNMDDSTMTRKHSWYEKRSLFYDKEGLVSDSKIEISRRVDGLEKHGIGMFIAWFVVGSLLLFTKRYFKSFYTVMHYVHAILGYLTLLQTIMTTVFIF